MTYVVVAFLYLLDGSGTFYKSGTFTDHAECEVEARELILAIDHTREEIALFASQCVANTDWHYPGENET